MNEHHIYNANEDKKHNDLPWEIDLKKDGERELYWINDKRGRGYPAVTNMYYSIFSLEEQKHTAHPNAKANIEFIVRACNSHYELLEAAKAAVNELNRSVHADDLDFSFKLKLEAAIAKAEDK